MKRGNHSLSSTSELKDHDEGAAWFQVVVTDLHLVSELLASEDQSDLVDFDSFPLLECVLDVQDGVVQLEVEVLLLSCQGLYDQLHFC